MNTIRATTLVDAPPEVVWAVITDLPRYQDWNPFITSLDGDLRPGGRLRATFSLAGRKPRTFTPTVTVLEPGRRLTWLGRLAVPGLFEAEHTLAVERRYTGAAFIHTEHFRGLLTPVMGRLLAATHEAFLAMDTALAHRAEALAADRSTTSAHAEPPA